MLDDFHNLEPLGYYGGIVDFESAQRFIFSNGSGPLGRPVAMASFLLNDSSWPTANIVGFKLTNIAFHLCTGLVIFLLISRLLQQEFNLVQRKAEIFALFVMAIWVLHPIHASTVLYIIQRMAILSALFSLATFLCYLQYRYHYRQQRGLYAALSAGMGILFFLLAIFSKENALLIIPFILLCELFIFHSLLPFKLKKLGRGITYAVFLSSPLWLYMTYDFWGKSYEFRDFTLADRLVLQIAVLGDYLGKLVLPTVSSLNLFDERFTSSAISISNFAFMKGFIFSIGLFVLFIYAIYIKHRLLVFGIVWFLCFHLMESSFLPLEIYYEHRNYLPSIGIFIVIVSLVNSLRKMLGSFTRFPVLLIGCYLIYLSFSSLILSKTWGDSSSLFIKFEGDAPSSVRAKVNYAAYFESRNLPEFALPLIEDAMALRPDLLSLTLAKMKLSCENNLKLDVSEHIEKIRNTSFFEIGALSQIKSLIAMNEEQCPILSDNPSLIEEILESVPSMKGDAHRPLVMANFFYIKVDYYVKNRMFEQAMDSIDKAIEYTPTVDLLLRKSHLLASAGLYQEALETLALTLKADEQRGFFIPTRSVEIKFFENLFKNHVSKGDF
jgi:tetratricopeptide (TPR) repeat protein